MNFLIVINFHNLAQLKRSPLKTQELIKLKNDFLISYSSLNASIYLGAIFFL